MNGDRRSGYKLTPPGLGDGWLVENRWWRNIGRDGFEKLLGENESWLKNCWDYGCGGVHSLKTPPAV